MSKLITDATKNSSRQGWLLWQSLHRGFYYQAQTHFQLGAPDVFFGVNMLQRPDYKLRAQNSALYPGSKSWVRQHSQRLNLYINDLTMPSNVKKGHAYYPLGRC